MDVVRDMRFGAHQLHGAADAPVQLVVLVALHALVEPAHGLHGVDPVGGVTDGVDVAPCCRKAMGGPHARR